MSDVVDDGTWQMAMDTIISAARLVSALPLDKMLRTTQVADSIGPIIHPSEYLSALEGNNWEGQKTLLDGAIRFRESLRAAENAMYAPTTEL